MSFNFIKLENRKYELTPTTSVGPLLRHGGGGGGGKDDAGADSSRRRMKLEERRMREAARRGNRGGGVMVVILVHHLWLAVGTRNQLRVTVGVNIAAFRVRVLGNRGDSEAR